MVKTCKNKTLTLGVGVGWKTVNIAQGKEEIPEVYHELPSFSPHYWGREGLTGFQYTC